MNHIGLFEGIGGFSLAAEWMGWDTVAWCEIEPPKQKWLSYRWPKAKGYADTRTVDYSVWRGKVDIVTGGDPCQVSSKIGKREGMEGALYLWPEFFRAVRESEPVSLVNENVDGTISNGILDQKIADLESIGYTCWPPIIIPASFIGASHRRDRVWLVAHSTKRRLEGRISSPPERQWETTIRPITSLVENQDGQIRPLPKFLTCDDGIPGWVDEIQGYGNAIVPQVAFELFKAIQQYHDHNTSA